MKKEEYIKLGITDNAVIRELQNLHGRDLEKLRRNVRTGGADNAGIREAIKRTVRLLESKSNLERVLLFVSDCYRQEIEGKNDIENKDNVQQ